MNKPAKLCLMLILCGVVGTQLCLASPLTPGPQIVDMLAALAVAQLPEEDEPAPPIHVARGEGGQVVLTVNATVQERIGLRVAKLDAVTRQPRVTAFGMLEDDPAQSATLRSPLNGFLRVSATGEWPHVGAQVHRGDVVGTVQPRFTSAESFDLLTRWTEALAEVQQLTAEVSAARASYENKQKLNAEGGLVSDRAVEDAEALLAGNEARLDAAHKKAAMIEGMLTGGGDAMSILQLEIPIDGFVAQVLVSPDECIDSGQPLLRVTNPSTLIARVNLPIGAPMPDLAAPARIIAAGQDERVFSAPSMGLATTRDVTTRGPTLLYRVDVGDVSPLRAGTPLRAHLVLPGEPVSGVLVPRSAIIRLGGMTWVYVQSAPDTFERHNLTLLTPEPDGWFTEVGVGPGDSVVVAGAQLLLSQEQIAQIEIEEEASE